MDGGTKQRWEGRKDWIVASCINSVLNEQPI